MWGPWGLDPEDAPLGTRTYRCKGCNGKYCKDCRFGDMWESAKQLHRVWEHNSATDDEIRACDGDVFACKTCPHSDRCAKLVLGDWDEHSNN